MNAFQGRQRQFAEPGRRVTHLVCVNFAGAEASIRLTTRSRGFDFRIFPATRLHLEATFPMRVN